MTVSKSAATAIAEEVRVAVEAILARHGMSVVRQSTRYGQGLKLTIEADPAGRDRSGDEYARYAWKLGLPDDGLGKIFVLGAEAYEVTGVAPRSRRYPLLARRVSDGKIYKFAVSPKIVDQIKEPRA